MFGTHRAPSCTGSGKGPAKFKGRATRPSTGRTSAGRNNPRKVKLVQLGRHPLALVATITSALILDIEGAYIMRH